MTQINIKRVYDEPVETDGYRVLVDRLWPRGMKKELLNCNEWAKDITPSADLRRWFHEDIPGRWNQFVAMYEKELENSSALKAFIDRIFGQKTVTLLYASKESVHNHARILQHYLQTHQKD